MNIIFTFSHSKANYFELLVKIKICFKQVLGLMFLWKKTQGKVDKNKENIESWASLNDGDHDLSELSPGCVSCCPEANATNY